MYRFAQALGLKVPAQPTCVSFSVPQGLEVSQTYRFPSNRFTVKSVNVGGKPMGFNYVPSQDFYHSGVDPCTLDKVRILCNVRHIVPVVSWNVISAALSDGKHQIGRAHV